MTGSNSCSPSLSKDDLRKQLMRFLDEDPADDDNLLDLGLTSIAAMQLVGEWKEARLDISFAELARCVTFKALWDLVADKASRRSIDNTVDHVVGEV